MAAVLSAALPGLGHLTLGRRLLGAIEMLIGLAILGAALAHLGLTFMDVLHGTARPLDLLLVCVPWGFVLVGFSILDGLFTWLVSRRRVVLSPRREGKP